MNKIYIVTESVMNGSVAIQSYTCGIEAPSFKDAADFLRKKVIAAHAEIPEDNHEVIRYTIPTGAFTVVGYMKSEPLTMMK